MRILVLTKKFPYPFKDGESVCIHNSLSHFDSDKVELHLLSFDTSKQYYNVSLNGVPSDLSYYTTIHTVDLDNRPKLLDAFINLFSSIPYHISRFKSDAFYDRLVELLSKYTFDIVQLESIYMAPYIEAIRKHTDARLVLRAHNVEHDIWDQLSVQSSNWFMKKYLSEMTRRLRKYEIRAIRKVDLLLTLSQDDMKSLRPGEDFPAQLAPVSVPLNRKMKLPGNRPFTIGFIGSLDWLPNIRGLEWFIHEVWTKLSDKYDEGIQCYIAGRNKPSSIQNLKEKGITIFGEEIDAVDFVQSLDLLIVPLFAGSGVRIKILEAMAYQTVVLSTKVGYSGIQVKPGVHLFEANTAQSFIDQICMLHENPDQLTAIEQNALSFIDTYHNPTINSEQLYETYKELM